ncbi:MAG: hypothetical protein IT530_16020 [Burkholderiales bacterium]|nr:hypothetical protein [Burkholderiales bacterium]
MKWTDVRDPTEWVVASVDFAPLISPGDALSVPTVSASVLRGTDGSPSAVLVGAPQIIGTVVAQLMGDAVDGVDYKLRFQAHSSSGRRPVVTVAIPVRAA